MPVRLYYHPEVRFYLGKGYGKGFYIAPFYRNLKYDITGVNFTYTNQIEEVKMILTWR
jgi:hypothetical protein